MGSMLSIFSNYQGYIILALCIIVIILFVMLIISFKLINKLENKYRKFMRGVDNKNIEQLVISYLDKVDESKKQTEYMNELYKSMEKRINGCFQKMSIIRYRAFEDVGSDLSFSIALLDNNDDGFILTGIYGRNESTTYAKPIDKGLSRYELSEEEKHVLQDAINKKII